MKRKNKQKAPRDNSLASSDSFVDGESVNVEMSSSHYVPKSANGDPEHHEMSRSSNRGRNLRYNSTNIENISGENYTPKMTQRGRRGRKLKGPGHDLPVFTSKSATDDHSSESRDQESSVTVTLSSEHEIPYDEDPARELRPLKEHPEILNSTFVEPRQPEKVSTDANLSHTQRKVNKRELKALLKQTKRRPSIIDETILAAMDELANRLKNNCLIDLNPPQPKPTPVAQLSRTADSASNTVLRRCVGGRRAGRRGRGARRGGFLLCSNKTEQSLLPASWVPLILPCPTRLATPEGVNYSDQNTSSDLNSRLCVPWLRQLPEARVSRFITNMRRILGSTRCGMPTQLTLKPITSADSSCIDDNTAYEGKNIESSFNPTSTPTHSIPILTTEDNHSRLSSSPLLLGKTDEDKRTNELVVSSDLSWNSRHVKTDPLVDNTSVTFTTNRLMRRRGRAKHSRLHRGTSYSKSNAGSVHTEFSSSAPLSGSTLNPQLQNSKSDPISIKSSVSRAKSRVSRELRGLVTWDAVMAEQRRRQQEQQTGGDGSVSNQAVEQTSVALSVVTDLLAAADDSLTPRLRRSRQFSGSGFSHTTQSAVGSDTTSMQTTIAASENTSYEVNYRSKPSEASSVAYSGLSTEVSSVSSDPAVLAKMLNVNPSDNSKQSKLSSRHQNELIGDQIQVDSFVDRPDLYSFNSELADSIGAVDSSCLAKYSPISVEQESSDPKHLLITQLDENSPPTDPHEVMPTSTVSRRKDKRKSNKQPKSRSTSICATQYEVTNVKIAEAAIDLSPGVNPQRFEPDPSLKSSQSPGGKRRRNSLNLSSIDHVGSDPLELLSKRTDLSAYNSSDKVQGVTAPVSTLRRGAATSRNSALPPRKRYKVGIENSTPNVESATTHDVGFWKNNVQAVSDSTTVISVTGFARDLSTIDIPADNQSVILDMKTQSRKRGRGRPSRRVDYIPPSESLMQLPQTSTLDSAAVPPDRPRREAAVIGFASLVASNLNNNAPISTSQDASGIKMEYENISSLNVSVLNIDQPVADVKAPITPRGRGRPPKHKPDQTLKQIEQSLSIDSIPNEPFCTINRPKRLAASQSLMNAYLDTAIKSNELTVKSEKINDLLPPSSQSVDYAPVSEVENLKSVEPIDHETKQTEKIQQPVIEESTKSYVDRPTKTKLSKQNRKTLRTQLNLANELPADTESHEIRTQNIGDSTKLDNMQGVLVSNYLPGRDSLFVGSLISESLEFFSAQNQLASGPVYDLFYKFLNEPDPKEPNCRLCAPFVYLPSPNRYPEFYRFLLTSYHPNSGLKMRFKLSFINELFNCKHNSEDSETDHIYAVEFPSLCFASIAVRFYQPSSCRENLPDCLRLFADQLDISDLEEQWFGINSSDIGQGLLSLDMAVDCLLIIWETFTGRRSWLGRRLAHLRSVYLKLRNDVVTGLSINSDIVVPAFKSNMNHLMTGLKSQNANTKKKGDRRALERGAEVIRCMCGFRVEGGHVMVQCDRCASWQHLPCLWWALSLAVRDELKSVTDSNIAQLCQTALCAAQAVGSGDGDSKSESEKCADAPYFCPVCLKLNKLTKEYPRSLSAAMSINDLDAVFSLQETNAKGEHEYWTLSSPDGSCQIRTDDYAFVSRFWFTCFSSFTPKKSLNKSTSEIQKSLQDSLQYSVKSCYDRVIIRIYRLWKDISGQAWLEGGFFLRPYDLPHRSNTDGFEISDDSRLWHPCEVVYDESSRVVLPLDAWIGRCVVLCPSAYKVGRPADLLHQEHLGEFGLTKGFNISDISHQTPQSHVFFVCDKLFERSSNLDSSTSAYRFDEISPGYLKINMKPYCFLRKPDAHCTRGSLAREYTATQLLENDRSLLLVKNPLGSVDENTQMNSVLTPPKTVLSADKNQETKSINVQNAKQKGEKLARVVDWLERKRQSKPPMQLDFVSEGDQKIQAFHDQPALPLISSGHMITEKMSTSTSPVRGRSPSRGSRGRGRGLKSSNLMSEDFALSFPDDTHIIGESFSNVPTASTMDEKKVSVSIMEDKCSARQHLNFRPSFTTEQTVNSVIRISDSVSEIQPICTSSENLSGNGKETESTYAFSNSDEKSTLDSVLSVESNSTSNGSSSSLPIKLDSRTEDSTSGIFKPQQSSHLTSPTLSTFDDQSNLSSPSLGSSRKRKCSVTRRRILPHSEPLLPLNQSNEPNQVCDSLQVKRFRIAEDGSDPVSSICNDDASTIMVSSKIQQVKSARLYVGELHSEWDFEFDFYSKLDQNIHIPTIQSVPDSQHLSMVTNFTILHVHSEQSKLPLVINKMTHYDSYVLSTEHGKFHMESESPLKETDLSEISHQNSSNSEFLDENLNEILVVSHTDKPQSSFNEQNQIVNCNQISDSRSPQSTNQLSEKYVPLEASETVCERESSLQLAVIEKADLTLAIPLTKKVVEHVLESDNQLLDEKKFVEINVVSSVAPLPNSEEASQSANIAEKGTDISAIEGLKQHLKSPTPSSFAVETLVAETDTKVQDKYHIDNQKHVTTNISYEISQLKGKLFSSNQFSYDCISPEQNEIVQNELEMAHDFPLNEDKLTDVKCRDKDPSTSENLGIQHSLSATSFGVPNEEEIKSCSNSVDGRFNLLNSMKVTDKNNVQRVNSSSCVSSVVQSSYVSTHARLPVKDITTPSTSVVPKSTGSNDRDKRSSHHNLSQEKKEKHEDRRHHDYSHHSHFHHRRYQDSKHSLLSPERDYHSFRSDRNSHHHQHQSRSSHHSYKRHHSSEKSHHDRSSSRHRHSSHKHVDRCDDDSENHGRRHNFRSPSCSSHSSHQHRSHHHSSSQDLSHDSTTDRSPKLSESEQVYH